MTTLNRNHRYSASSLCNTIEWRKNNEIFKSFFVLSVTELYTGKKKTIISCFNHEYVGKCMCAFKTAETCMHTSPLMTKTQSCYSLMKTISSLSLSLSLTIILFVTISCLSPSVRGCG